MRTGEPQVSEVGVAEDQRQLVTLSHHFPFISHLVLEGGHLIPPTTVRIAVSGRNYWRSDG